MLLCACVTVMAPHPSAVTAVNVTAQHHLARPREH